MKKENTKSTGNELHKLAESKWQIVWISKNGLRTVVAASIPGKDNFKVVYATQNNIFGSGKKTEILGENMKRTQAIRFMAKWVKENK